MGDDKIPSRSDRHKKKGSLFSTGGKQENTKQSRDWYFSDRPEEKPAQPKGAAAAEAHKAVDEAAAALDRLLQRPIKIEEPKPKAEEPKAVETKPAAPEREPEQEPVREVQRIERKWKTPGQADSAEPEPKQRKEKRLSGKKRNLIGIAALLFLLLSGAWCGYAAVNAVLPDPYAGMDKEMLNNINILVLGCDEREGDTAARADVIMVATIRPDAKEVSVFSIPRDTRVEIPGHKQDKINHAMAYGGIPLVQSCVENLLNIKIDHYVKINFDGFINVIDALGGVNVDVPCRMYKPLEAIDLQPGYQTLYGEEALAFVRWRGDGTGDYGRIGRQQEFINVLSAKLKSMNLSQALDVASAVMDSIETDMSVKQMTSYGVNLIGLDSGKVHTYSFVGNELWLNGVNYVEPDMDAIAGIVDKMQHGEPEPEVTEEQPQAEEPAA